LFSRFFDWLAASGTFSVLKELQFPAPFVFAPYHQQFPAGIAFFTTDKGLSPADRAGGSERPAAAGTNAVASLNWLKTRGALESERRTTFAFGTKPGIPL